MKPTLFEGAMLCFLALMAGVLAAVYLNAGEPVGPGFTREQAQALRGLVARSKTREEARKELYHPRTEAERVAAIAGVFEAESGGDDD